MDKNKAFTDVVNEAQTILNKYSDKFSNANIDIGDTPISPIMLEYVDTPVYFSKEVTKEYEKLIKKINDPDTAYEYSFILLGKNAIVEGVKSYIVFYLLHCDGKGLNNRAPNKDDNVIQQYVKFADNHQYDFISLGVTHPSIKKSDYDTSIVNYLNDKTKKDYRIKDHGLNITLQDIIYYNSFYNNIKKFYPNIRTICHTVILKDNSIKLIGKVQGGYSVSNTIYLARIKENPDFNKDQEESDENKKYIQDFEKLETKKD